MPLALRKSLQEFFVLSDGYSISRYNQEDEYVPSWSIELVRSLGPESFKKLCAEYFEEKSYRAKINTQQDKKYIDIWLFKESYSHDQPFGIVKCWKQKAIPVDIEDLDDFKKITSKNPVPFATLITAGEFKKQAFDDLDKKIQLIDGAKLYSLIQKLPDVRKQRLLKNISK